MIVLVVRRCAAWGVIAAAVIATVTLPCTAAERGRPASAAASAPAAPPTVTPFDPFGRHPSSSAPTLTTTTPSGFQPTASQPEERTAAPGAKPGAPTAMSGGSNNGWPVIAAIALAIVALGAGAVALALAWLLRERLGRTDAEVQALELWASNVDKDAQNIRKELDAVVESFEGLRRALQMANAELARIKPEVSAPARAPLPDNDVPVFPPRWESAIFERDAFAAPEPPPPSPLAVAGTRRVPLTELFAAVQDAADRALADGTASDKDMLTNLVAARMGPELSSLVASRGLKVCAHNSSVDLGADFRNPDFLTVSHPDGRCWLLPNPRARYAHSFTKYFEGNGDGWPRFKIPATCSVDASNKASILTRGQL